MSDASVYTEASLKALTVPKLKELLASHSLPVVGNKPDLIARILSTPSLTPSTPATVDTTGPSSSVDEPDGSLGLSGGAETTAAVATETERSAEGVREGLELGSKAEAVEGGAVEKEEKKAEQPTVSEEEKAEKAKVARDQEEERRQKRLARFGGPSTTEESEEEKAKKARAEKYGTAVAAENDGKGAGLDKSLAALDRPLGQKRQREPKPAKDTSAAGKAEPTSKAGVTPKNGVASAEPAAAAVMAEKKEKEVDPELKAKIEAEEEKKRKRAERFGPPPGAAQPEKKAKLDDSTPAVTA